MRAISGRKKLYDLDREFKRRASDGRA